MAKVTKMSPGEGAAAQPPVQTAGPAAKAMSSVSDAISRRAYELFMARGGQHGRDQDDWLQAERELRLGRQ